MYRFFFLKEKKSASYEFFCGIFTTTWNIKINCHKKLIDNVHLVESVVLFDLFVC
jgi:hypothetical protein